MTPRSLRPSLRSLRSSPLASGLWLGALAFAGGALVPVALHWFLQNEFPDLSELLLRFWGAHEVIDVHDLLAHGPAEALRLDRLLFVSLLAGPHLLVVGVLCARHAKRHGSDAPAPVRGASVAFGYAVAGLVLAGAVAILSGIVTDPVPSRWLPVTEPGVLAGATLVAGGFGAVGGGATRTSHPWIVVLAVAVPIVTVSMLFVMGVGSNPA